MPVPPHHVLGISSQAKENEIRQAYRELAKKWHPDKYSGNLEYANEQFKRIKGAYETMIIHLGNQPKPPKTTSNHHQSQQNPGFYPTFMPRRGPRVQFARQTSVPASNTSTRPNVGCTQTGCPSGPVLFPGNFHPSQMSYQMLQQLRQTRGS
jgi:hypothetical protein